jgi:hypothetical protein
MKNKCPICQLDCEILSKGALFFDVNCRRCGSFRVTLPPDKHNLETLSFAHVPDFLLRKGVSPHDVANVGRLLAPYLSIYVREQTDSGHLRTEVDIGTATKLEELAATYADTPIALKPERLLRLLEKRSTYPGALATVDARLDYPAIHALTPDEFRFHLDHVADRRWILGGFPDGASVISTKITHEGWAQLGATGISSRIGFVAMSFDPSLNAAYTLGIEPAIRGAEYEPLRIDKVHHNEKICDRIISEIRRARFMVADVTLQRPGVYFEAGYAMALGLPVIWCCRKDDSKNIHFDTRQYSHIFWETPSDLLGQLLDRIRATI